MKINKNAVLKENLEQLKKSWKQQKISLAESLSEKEIVDEFAKINVPVSKDLIEFYTNFGGFDENDMDSELLNFWTIEKILKENDPSSEHNFSDEYIYFADHLLDSYWYGFKFDKSDCSAVFISYDKDDNHKIANSFDEFFELYLKNPYKLLFEQNNL